MIIGITGPSGSGKTTISDMLKERLKCSSINADDVAKELAKRGTTYYKDIVDYFGEEILSESKEIDRKKLADIIYEDETKREALNVLTNVHVAKEIETVAIELSKNDIVIIDVPRLIESGLGNICDIVISVLADEDIKIKRICKRDNIDIEVAKKRLGIQPKDKFYIKNSNYVINNNNDNIEEQIKAIVSVVIKENK